MNARSSLIEKIETLPDDRIAEIEAFVSYLQQEEEWAGHTVSLRKKWTGITTRSSRPPRAIGGMRRASRSQLISRIP
jgi:hypothetical protein